MRPLASCPWGTFCPAGRNSGSSVDTAVVDRKLATQLQQLEGTVLASYPSRIAPLCLLHSSTVKVHEWSCANFMLKWKGVSRTRKLE